MAFEPSWGSKYLVWSCRCEVDVDWKKEWRELCQICDLSYHVLGIIVCLALSMLYDIDETALVRLSFAPCHVRG
jgi:hypothetical protein